jgi:TM2 domain-containing membrane protein YozV
MFCRNCGTQLDDRAIACTKCGVNPHNGVAFCQNCGKPTVANAAVCVSCGVGLAQPAGAAKARAGNKLAAGICGILLGSLGIHKFILGYTTPALIMLLVSVLTCGIGATVMAVIGIIEGIIYLTKSDEEFGRTYVDSQKHWF